MMYKITVLRTEDNLSFHTIKDVLNQCLGMNFDGYQKGKYNINNYYMAWFPQIAYEKDGVIHPGSENKGWINHITDNGLFIEEINENEKRDEDGSQFEVKRLVFAKLKGEDYKFLGVYKTISYADKTVPHAKRVHQRIATEINLGSLGKKSHSSQDQVYIEDVFKYKEISETEKLALVKCRIGQSDFRKKLLDKYGERCVLCGLSHKELLIASHIKAWKDANENERMDEENGLLLCTLHDSLFDKDLITFDDDGKIIISSKIKDINKPLLNISEDLKIEMSDTMRKYMESHRKIFSQ